MASSVIYYSTYARQNEIYLFYTSKVLKNGSEKSQKNIFCRCVTATLYVVCTLYFKSARTLEPMKLFHLYELFYKGMCVLNDQGKWIDLAGSGRGC